jgi:predicted LPLAT superfamily acyltransferase
LKTEKTGSPLQFAVFHLLIRLGARRVVGALLCVVVFWYVLFRPSVRRRAVPYLQRRFSGIRGFQKFRAVFLMDLGFGQALVDRAAVSIVGPQAITIEFPQRYLMRELLAEGKGLILLTAHVGGWQASLGALSMIKAPINLLLHLSDADMDSSTFQQLGTEEASFAIIDPGEELGGILRMMEVLRRGETISMMGDRVFGSLKNTVLVPFLGDHIRLPYSAFKVASAMGSPIAVFFPYRTPGGSYTINVDSIIRVPSGLGRRAEEFVEYVGGFAKGMERYVEAHPYQFYNFFDMWKDDPLEPDAMSMQ